MVPRSRPERLLLAEKPPAQGAAHDDPCRARGKEDAVSRGSFELAEHAVDAALSPVEVRVLRLIAQGNSNREIAGHLSATEEAIKSHVSSIFRNWTPTIAHTPL